MIVYDFAHIEARPELTLADVNNKWIFGGVKHVINVGNYNKEVEEAILAKGCTYDWLHLEEEPTMDAQTLLKAAQKIREYLPDLGRIIVCCVGGNNRSRTVIELFYYLTTGQHLVDEYKGCQNHLLYNINCGFLDEHILDASLTPELDSITTYHHDLTLLQLTQPNGSTVFLEKDYNSDECTGVDTEYRPLDAHSITEAIYKYLQNKSFHYRKSLEQIVEESLRIMQYDQQIKDDSEKRKVKKYVSMLRTADTAISIEDMHGLIFYDGWWCFYDGTGRVVKLHKNKDIAFGKLIKEGYVTKEDSFFVHDIPVVTYTSYNDTIYNILEAVKEKINKKIPRSCVACEGDYDDKYSTYDIISYLHETYDWDEIIGDEDLANVIYDFISVCFSKNPSNIVLELFFEDEYEVEDGIVKSYNYEGVSEQDAICRELFDILCKEMSNRGFELEQEIADDR